MRRDGLVDGERGAICAFAPPGARAAAALLDEPDAGDRHAAVDRLGHVVDGEAGDRRRRSAPPSRRRSCRRPWPSRARGGRGASSSGSISTATAVEASGWQSGISSCVRLAAMMPAIRAVPITSPFLALPARISASVVARHRRPRPRRSRSRSVTGFAADVDHVGRAGLVEMGEARRRPCAHSAAATAGRPSSARVAAATSACAHQALADEVGADADRRRAARCRPA